MAMPVNMGGRSWRLAQAFRAVRVELAGALIAQVVKTAAHPVHTWLCELQRTLYQTLVLAAWLGAIE